jgi:hypothetical protein
MTDQSAGSTQEDVVNVPQSWARDGHVVRDPRIWPVIRAGIATLIADLEAAKPASLDGMRRRFCEMPRLDDAVAIPRLLEARFELLVASNLAQVGALQRIRADTPDFDCRWDGADLGIEATTRAREEIASALERAMEQGQWGDVDVHVTLTRTGKLLFSEPPEMIAEVGERVTAEITKAIGDGGSGQLKRGNIPIPEFGLSAMWTAGVGIGLPGVRVAYDSVLTFTEEEWEYHWKMAAMQVKNTVEGKGKKRYDSPSIAVVDISRLGETSRLLSADGIAKYQQTLDDCNLGNLRGALLVRTTLTSRFIESLCARIDGPEELAALAAQLTANPNSG